MLVVGTVVGGPEVRRPRGTSREDPLDAAIREISIPESEVCAFLNFRDCLKEHFGRDWYCWRRVEEDPPDYLLWLCGRQDPIGVEVTTLKACEELLRANATVDMALRFLQEEAAKIKAPGAMEILYEPDSPESVPNRREYSQQFAPLLDHLRGLTEAASGERVITGRFGKISVWGLGRASGGIRILNQGFFRVADESHWGPDINEAIKRKTDLYRSAPHEPCWLLLNLKPYLVAVNEAEQFVSTGVKVEHADEVASVFERVYAVTGYIPAGSRPPRSPLRRLL